MKFKDFKIILSEERTTRYVNACNGNTRKAMTLYRENLHLSQEMFTLISCFEVALRFPNRPKSSATMQYNNTYIFNELDGVNNIRNRIAHHEPICFMKGSDSVSTSYLLQQYQRIQTMFSWMGVDAHAMLYGLDHVQQVCNRILLL